MVNDLEINQQINPFDPLVKQIESRGMTLEEAFIVFDGNGDQILTLQELRDGIKNLELNMSEELILELSKQIDQDSDGVLTKQEFLNTISPPLEVRKEFRNIL